MSTPGRMEIFEGFTVHVIAKGKGKEEIAMLTGGLLKISSQENPLRYQKDSIGS
jgi:hypothetical protein